MAFSGDKLIELRRQGLCLQCGVNHARSLGQNEWADICADCYLHQKPASRTHPKRERQAGLANLDRLMGNERPLRWITLTSDELDALYRQPEITRRDGGFQRLMVRLQEQTDSTGRIRLDEDDLKDIQRHAFDYQNGGWQTRLRAIFGRSLGSDLGRPVLDSRP